MGIPRCHKFSFLNYSTAFCKIQGEFHLHGGGESAIMKENSIRMQGVRKISGEKGSRCDSGATAITVFCVKQTHQPLNVKFEKARLWNLFRTISQETCLVCEKILFLGKRRMEDQMSDAA